MTQMTATKDKNMTQPSDTDKPEMILVCLLYTSDAADE